MEVRPRVGRVGWNAFRASVRSSFGGAAIAWLVWSVMTISASATASSFIWSPILLAIIVAPIAALAVCLQYPLVRWAMKRARDPRRDWWTAALVAGISASPLALVSVLPSSGYVLPASLIWAITSCVIVGRALRSHHIAALS